MVKPKMKFSKKGKLPMKRKESGESSVTPDAAASTSSSTLTMRQYFADLTPYERQNLTPRKVQMLLDLPDSDSDIEPAETKSPGGSDEDAIFLERNPSMLESESMFSKGSVDLEGFEGFSALKIHS